MPPRGRPKRNAAKVDYSKFADPHDANGADDDVNDDDVEMLDIPNESEDDDIAVDESGKEEEEDELEEDSIEIIVEEVIAKKGKKGKTPTKKLKKDKSQETTPTKSFTPKKEVKAAKQLTSIKDRLTRIYGFNEEKLIDLVTVRREWEQSLFQFDIEDSKEDLEFEHIAIPAIQFKPLSPNEYQSKFPIPDLAKNFQYENKGVEALAPGSSTIHDGSIVLNTGGLITDLVWLSHSKQSKKEVLAISLSNITDTINAAEFRLLTKTSYPGIIQLYTFDSETKEIQLTKTLLHYWGSSWDLKQAPISSGNDNEVIISGVFNDGAVRVLKINISDSNQLIEVTKSSLEFSIPGYQISSYDWNDGSIIAGTSSGHVSEFVIDPSDTTPSFLFPLHSGYIFSISASISPYDDPLIYATCADGSAALFSTADIQSSINRTVKTRAVCKTVVYSPHVHSFVQLEGPYTIKAIPARALFGSTSLSKHDGSAESVAVSRLHPLVLSGGSDGRLKIHNIARRLLNSQKYISQAHRVLTLLELQYGANEDTYRIVKPLEVESLPANDNVSNANVYPPEVSINSLRWNETTSAGSWFAAGTTSGLLILQSV